MPLHSLGATYAQPSCVWEDEWGHQCHRPKNSWSHSGTTCPTSGDRPRASKNGRRRGLTGVIEQQHNPRCAATQTCGSHPVTTQYEEEQRPQGCLGLTWLRHLLEWCGETAISSPWSYNRADKEPKQRNHPTALQRQPATLSNLSPIA